MPFTPAHPAAVLPLLRPPFVGAALVAGSVAPDVPYFLRAAGIPVSAQAWYEPLLNATTSHSPTGVPLVALPLALAGYVGYLVARRPVTDLGPLLAPGGTEPPPARPGWVGVSLLLGVLTHLAWDALTWNRVVQHLSSAVGLVVVAAFLWRRRNRALARRRVVALLGLAGVVGAVGTAVGTREWWRAPDQPLSARDLVEGVLSDAATGAGVAAAVALAAVVTGWWLRAALLSRPPRDPSR